VGTFIGRIEYEIPILLKRFYVQARIGDDPEHPYGQWSLVVDPLSIWPSYLVKAQFGAPDAPAIGAAHIATKIELFRGVRKIGTLTVIEVVCP